MSPCLALLFACAAPPVQVQVPSEADYYPIVSIAQPEGLSLEVGGIAILPDGRPIVATRRGQVFVLDNAYSEDGQDVEFGLFADGLQEPMGLLVHEGWIYVAQRGELSRMRDVDGDDRVDELETVCDDWRISGNYHEYNFGPRLDSDGNFWITTNKPFGDDALRGGPLARLRVAHHARRRDAADLLRPALARGHREQPHRRRSTPTTRASGAAPPSSATSSPATFHGHPWGIGSCDMPQWKYEIPARPPDGRLMPAGREAARRASSCPPCGSPTTRWASRPPGWCGTRPAAPSVPSRARSSSATSTTPR